MLLAVSAFDLFSQQKILVRFGFSRPGLLGGRQLENRFVNREIHGDFTGFEGFCIGFKILVHQYYANGASHLDVVFFHLLEIDGGSFTEIVFSLGGLDGLEEIFR